MKLIGFKHFLIVFLIITVSSCSALKTDEEDHENRGYVTKFSDFSSIEPGKTSRDEVLQILGSPVTKSMFGKEEWIYAGGEVTKETFFEPEVKSYESYVIGFDEKGIVSSVNGNNSLREFEISEDKTISGGNSLTLFQQLLGNVGRFNNAQRVGAGGTSGQ